MHINMTSLPTILLTCLAAGAAAAPPVHENYLDDLYPPAMVLEEAPVKDLVQRFQTTDGRVRLDSATTLAGQPALKFEVADPTSSSRRASAEAVVPVRPGQLYRFKAAYRTVPAPDASQIGGYGMLTLHWLGPDGRSLPTRDKLMSRPGAETDWTARDIKALAPPGATHARLGLVAGWHEAHASAAAWFGAIAWSVMQPAPVQLSLSPRVLRNLDEPMTIRIERTAIANLTTDGRFIVRLHGPTGDTLRQWVEPILITLPWQTTLRLPPGAEGGSVSVTIEPVRNQPGYTGYRVSESLLVAHSDVSSRLRDGRFVMDGQPRLVIGAYHAEPPDYAALKEAGFNVVMTKHYDADAAKKELDELQALGLYGFEHLGGGGQTLANRARLRPVIEAIGDHPALLAWNLMDEPTRKGIGPREIAEHGVWAQSLAPRVPTTVNEAGPYLFDHFGPTTDAFCVDPYPVYFWAGLRRAGDPPADLAGVTRWMNHARAATPPGRALIGIVECFTFDPAAQPAATGEEVRNMMAQVIASGASAVMIYSVRDTGGWRLLEQPQFQTIKAFNRELLELEPWLVTDPIPAAQAPTLTCDRPDHLLAATWVRDGKPLTVLINLDRQPLAVVMNDAPIALDPLAVRWIRP